MNYKNTEGNEWAFLLVLDIEDSAIGVIFHRIGLSVTHEYKVIFTGNKQTSFNWGDMSNNDFFEKYYRDAETEIYQTDSEPVEINREQIKRSLGSDALTQKCKELVVDIFTFTYQEKIPPEIAFMTICTAAFSIMFNETPVGEKVAVEQAAEIAKAVYDGQGLEKEAVGPKVIINGRSRL